MFVARLGSPSGIDVDFTVLSACYSRFHYSVLRFSLQSDTFSGLFLFFSEMFRLMNSLFWECTPRYWIRVSSDRRRSEILRKLKKVHRNCRERGNRVRRRFGVDEVRSRRVKEMTGRWLLIQKDETVRDGRGIAEDRARSSARAGACRFVVASCL